MPSRDFDIYHTDRGYLAVTSPVRRAILAALAERPRQLPELMRLVGRSKPALSLQIKELSAQGLVEEAPHPTDGRRKVFRAKGRKIGSSNLPVGELRSAVREYASGPGAAARLPLSAALDALSRAPGATPEVLRAQASRLGELAAPFLRAGSPRELLLGLSSFLEAEGLAQTVRLDLERLRLEARLGKALPQDVPRARLTLLLAAFATGACHARGLPAPRARPRRGSALLVLEWPG